MAAFTLFLPFSASSPLFSDRSVFLRPISCIIEQKQAKNGVKKGHIIMGE